MAEKTGIPVGYGVDQAMIESIGGYWEANREFSQPAEFIIRPDGTIAMLSYSDGPLSRMEAADAVRTVSYTHLTLPTT